MLKKGKLASINDKEVVVTVDSAAPVQLNGDLYTQTVRCKSCQILTNDTKCAQCVQYRDSLRKSFHHWKKKIDTSPRRNTASTSHTNLRYLNTLEKQQRYHKLKVRSDTAERKAKRRMEKLTEKGGVQWEEGMHHDLQSIMNEMTTKVRDQHSEDLFPRIFWEAQLEAMQTKDHQLASSTHEMVPTPEVQVNS